MILSKNMNTLFQVNYNPLQQVLSSIVDELNVQRDVLEKLLMKQEFSDIGNEEEFYEDPPQKKLTNIKEEKKKTPSNNRYEDEDDQIEPLQEDDLYQVEEEEQNLMSQEESARKTQSQQFFKRKSMNKVRKLSNFIQEPSEIDKKSVMKSQKTPLNQKIDKSIVEEDEEHKDKSVSPERIHQQIQEQIGTPFEQQDLEPQQNMRAINQEVKNQSVKMPTNQSSEKMAKQVHQIKSRQKSREGPPTSMSLSQLSAKEKPL